MRLTVLGGRGAWPGANEACSGYLLEHQGYRLLVDPGYAIVPRLLGLLGADQVDAVFVSHGHPDHCADLNPLLRARALTDSPSPAPLPVYAPPGALDVVLALDRPGVLDDAYRMHHLTPERAIDIGPFGVRTALLPHSMPNLGVRLECDGLTMVYTGDSGPGPGTVSLAQGSDLLLAEASYVADVAADMRGQLSSAVDAGRQARAAGVSRLVLTHLLPGTDDAAAHAAATAEFGATVDVAHPGLVVNLT